VHTPHQPRGQQVLIVAVRSPVLGVGAGAGAVGGLTLHLDIPSREEGDRATADHRPCTD
jgi:hypothetical protein